jgi:non-ribosomal peptide synthase protein (TIGR01720 family)
MSTIPASQAEQGLVAGSAPLMPVQRWFFEEWYLGAPHHYIMPTLIELEHTVNYELLEPAVRHIVMHHDALRTRFVQTEAGRQQFITETESEETKLLLRADLSMVPEAELEQVFDRTVTQLKMSLDLSQGPLMKVVLFDLGAHKPKRLLIILHHLICDGFSRSVVLQDLQRAYEQLSQGDKVQLPRKTTSIKQWAERLVEYGQSAALRQESSYWLDLPWSQVVPLPVEKEANIAQQIIQVQSSLSPEETHALVKASASNQIQLKDLLLAALTYSLAQWTNFDVLLVDEARHGRDKIFSNINLSRTVGYCVTHVPLLLDLRGTSSIKSVLHSIKTQLGLVPNNGIGYGVLRYLSQDVKITEQLRSFPQPELLFLYHGYTKKNNDSVSMSPLIRRLLPCTALISNNRPPRKIIFQIRIYEDQLSCLLDSWYQCLPNEAIAQNFMDVLRSFLHHL